MGITEEQIAEAVRGHVHYSFLEIASNLATILTGIVALFAPLALIIGFGALMVYLISPQRGLLPLFFTTLIGSALLYGVLLLGALGSLGLWCGLGLLAASYPILKRIARRRAERRITASA